MRGFARAGAAPGEAVESMAVRADGVRQNQPPVGPSFAFPLGQELRDGIRVLVRLMAFLARRIHLAPAEEDIRLGGGLLIIHMLA